MSEKDKLIEASNMLIDIYTDKPFIKIYFEEKRFNHERKQEESFATQVKFTQARWQALTAEVIISEVKDRAEENYNRHVEKWS